MFLKVRIMRSLLVQVLYCAGRVEESSITCSFRLSHCNL